MTNRSSHAGVVALRSPPSPQEVVSLIDRYFVAVAHESSTELSGVLSEDATMTLLGQTNGTSAMVVWIRRFARADHGDLADGQLFDRSQLELYTAQELEALRGLRRFQLTPREGEYLVRVSFLQRDRQQRLGTEMQALVEWVDGVPSLREIYEDLVWR